MSDAKLKHDTTLLYLTTQTNLHASILKENNTSSLKEHHLYIPHQHSQKSHILTQSNFRNQILQEIMAFLGETSSQTIVNSRLGFIFPNGSIIYNESNVYFQSSTPIHIQVPNDCGFEALKSRMHNTLQLTNN